MKHNISQINPTSFKKMNKKRKFDEVVKRNSENDGKSKVDDYGRRVWDKQYFKQKVEEKKNEEDADADENELLLRLMPNYKKKKEFPKVTEKKLLEGRKEEISLDKNLGKVHILTLKTPKEQQGGYYCEICDCVLKDSQTYLDHINGKNHNRMLGFSMNVKKVTVDEVKKKLELLKKKKMGKFATVAKNPYEEAKQNAQEIERIDELRRHKRKEKRMLKKSKKEGKEDAQKDKEKELELELEQEQQRDTETGTETGTETDADTYTEKEKEKKKNETEVKNQVVEGKQTTAQVAGVDVEETEFIENDINLEMAKLGLPTTFV